VPHMSVTYLVKEHTHIWVDFHYSQLPVKCYMHNYTVVAPIEVVSGPLPFTHPPSGPSDQC